MKKKFLKLISLVVLVVGNLVNATPAFAQEKKVLKVCAILPDMLEIVEVASRNIADPYEIEVVEVSDYNQSLDAVNYGEVFANLTSSKPVMELYNQEMGAELVDIQPIYNTIVGFYSKKIDNLDQLEDGAEIAITDHAATQGHCLLLLEKYGLIKLKEGASYDANLTDIEENPRNFKFTEMDLLNLSAAYEDGVDLVFNYPAYIAKVGLTVKDAVFTDYDIDPNFAQMLIIHKDNVETPEEKALLDAFTCQEVYDLLEERAKKGNILNCIENPSSKNKD